MTIALTNQARERAAQTLWPHWNEAPTARHTGGPDSDLARLLDLSITLLGAHRAEAIWSPAGQPGQARVLATAGDVAEEGLAPLLVLEEAGASARGLPHESQGVVAEWLTRNAAGAAEDVLRMRVALRDAGASMVLGFFFVGRRGDRQAGLAEKVATVQALVATMLPLWNRNRRTELTARYLASALDGLDTAVILIDRLGRVRQANAAAEAMLEAGDYLRRVDESLAASDLTDSLALQVAINDVISGQASGLVPPSLLRPLRTPILTLRSHRHERQMTVAVMGCEDLPAGADEPAAIVFALNPTADIEEELRALCRLYGLSQVETHLTVLLSGGMCLQEAAEALRIKELTARSYLKQVFLKTDTRRQADLVRLLVSGILRLRLGRPLEVLDRRAPRASGGRNGKSAFF